VDLLDNAPRCPQPHRAHHNSGQPMRYLLRTKLRARYTPKRGGRRGEAEGQTSAEFDEAVDRSQHMVAGHMLFELKLVEQSTPIDLPLTHHHLHSASITGVNHLNNPAAASDFSTESAQTEHLAAFRPLRSVERTRHT
jgi:hypothetical protein